jgi:hypothetical protein
LQQDRFAMTNLELAMCQKNLTHTGKIRRGGAQLLDVYVEGPSVQDYRSELFRGNFDPLMGAVLPPVILSQVPTGT